MYSVIVSSVDASRLNNILLPSLERIKKFLFDNQLPPLQIIVINGSESITKNYNDGMLKSKNRLKFFIHDDVDIMDIEDVPLFVKIDNLFLGRARPALVGLAGTQGLSNGWWWETPKEKMVGRVFMGGNIQQLWDWNSEKDVYSNVNYIDGIFMATDTNTPFSEDIKGFHLYDSDYCNKMRLYGYEISVINHLVKHEWFKKDFSTDFTYYRQKWNLGSESLRNY